jgi:hypothetical protein
MLTWPNLLPSATATTVAVIVTVTGLAGGVTGALYVTEVPVALVRTPEPVPDAGDIVHLTP